MNSYPLNLLTLIAALTTSFALHGAVVDWPRAVPVDERAAGDSGRETRVVLTVRDGVAMVGADVRAET
ncbi:hypothetical protein [Marinimicrobium locisalis]|uniref:hypothetical protein n=1 Tax=Marinimicrobium locisalis TaxID=546022 RepID=UPI003221DCE6